MLNQTYQTKPAKPNLANQTYQIKPTKPNLQKLQIQTYYIKPTKPNLPYQIYQTYYTKLTKLNKKPGKPKLALSLAQLSPSLLYNLQCSNIIQILPQNCPNIAQNNIYTLPKYDYCTTIV